MPSDSVLLFDGLCNFCNASVQFILARDRTGTLRFAPLQGAFAAGVLERHPAARAMNSLVLVHPATADRPERLVFESSAALEIARYLGRVWRGVATVLAIVPRPLRDAGYRLVARVRYRIFGKRSAAVGTRHAERARFLD
jgi:predicted DCC family thiol-disulfide oxidoreductase YuxK